MSGQRKRHGLDVPGRPAAEWVLTLPATWTTAKERLILLVYALDTFDQQPPFRAAPSLTELQRRLGETRRSTLTDALDELCEPRSTGRNQRPALLELVERGRGTISSTYRLRDEVHGAEYSRATGGESPTATAVVHRPATGGGSPTSSGASGGASSGASSGGSPTTPVPSTSSTYPPTSGTGRARSEAGDGEGPVDDELTTALRGLAAAHDGVRADTPKLVEVVRRLIAAGWTAEQLVERAATEDLRGTYAPGGALAERLGKLGSPPYRRPPWCGTCDERTRMREDNDGRPSRCPRCHPARAGDDR